MPLPIRFIQWLINRFSHPAMILGACIVGLLLGFYVVSNSFYPADIMPAGVDPLEATGLFLLLSILPAYLMMCLVTLVRNTPLMTKSIQQVLPETQHHLLSKLDQTKLWFVWVLLGILFAVFGNIAWESLSFSPSHERFNYSLSIVIGQTVTWSVIGLVLGVSFHNSLVLYKMGEQARIDIYDLDTLNSFGRYGLSTLLMIVGALAFTPLQSIDTVFRWDNYSNALIVAVPAAIVFILLPIWPLHERIKQEKRDQLSMINKEIAAAPKGLDSSSLGDLNALLERRSYIQHCRNWPMDMSIFSRVVFYVLIPPLAWAGAALMELALDAYLVG